MYIARNEIYRAYPNGMHGREHSWCNTHSWIGLGETKEESLLLLNKESGLCTVKL